VNKKEMRREREREKRKVQKFRFRLFVSSVINCLSLRVYVGKKEKMEREREREERIIKIRIHALIARRLFQVLRLILFES